MAQQLQRRAVGPVQVVEHEHHRRVGADLAQQRAHGVEEAEALRVGVGARDRARGDVRGRRAELRQQDRELRGARPQPVAQGVQRRARRPSAQHLHHRLIRRQRLLVEAPVEDDRAALVGLARELGREPRLADPGVAREQHQCALAVGRLAPASAPGTRARRPARPARGGRRRRPSATATAPAPRPTRAAPRRPRRGGRGAARRAAPARRRPSPPVRASCRAPRAAANAAPRRPAAPRPGSLPPRGSPSAAGARTRGTAPPRSPPAPPARPRPARARPGAAPPRPASPARAAAASPARAAARPPSRPRRRAGTSAGRSRARHGRARQRARDRRPPSPPRPRRSPAARPRCRPAPAPRAAAAARHGPSARPRRARVAASRAARSAPTRPRPAGPRATARRSIRRVDTRAYGSIRGTRRAGGPAVPVARRPVAAHSLRRERGHTTGCPNLRPPCPCGRYRLAKVSPRFPQCEERIIAIAVTERTPPEAVPDKDVDRHREQPAMARRRSRHAQEIV